jgi:hypothetical protein
MAAHGPIPKRSEERRRRNKPETPIDKVQAVGPVTIPSANPKWHPVAKRIYESLESSGQSKFYESSDWATAYLLAESLSRDLEPQFITIAEKKTVTKAGTVTVEDKPLMLRLPLKGASLAAYLKGFAALGVTEGDRRRIGIEIDRKPKAPGLASVSVMDEYRDAFGG